MRALFPQLLQAERDAGSILRSLRARPACPSPHGAFVSLPGGVGELVDALAAALGADTAQRSARVIGVRRADRFAIESVSSTLRARVLILGVPAWAAAALLGGLDPTLAGLCDAVPYASTATVALGYRRDQIRHPLNGSGFVVPRVEQSPLLAATWVTSKWPGRAPDGHALLRAFLGGGRDPHVLERSDDELVATGHRALAQLLHIVGDPLLTRLYRFPRQNPQYEVGHLERVAAIERRAASIPGLFLTGSGFRAIGIPDCIADARATAGRVVEYLGVSRS
jgi:oxygen-dependent protoporphyrinogen oxidase